MDYFKWKELDRIEEDKPFTPRQTKEEIKLETDNFTLDKGVFRYGFEEEARIAVKYLEQKGYHAEMNITDNPLFAPEHESYNVWFSKEELPDGYESGEWLKEDLEEPEEYFVGSVAIAGTPEEAQKEFKELGYNVRVEKSAIDHFDTYYLIDIYGSKEELEKLANDPVEQGLFTEDEIKSTLEEGRKKKALDKGMGMWQWPNPEKGVEMFNHAVGADAVSTGASEGTSECLHEEAMYSLFLEVRDSDGDVVKDKIKIDVGSQSEMEEKKKHLEEVSPKDNYGNDNIYTVEFIGNSSYYNPENPDKLTEGKYVDLNTQLSQKKEELKNLRVSLENAPDEEAREDLEISIDILENDIANIEGELAEIRYLDNGSSSNYDGYESLKESKELSLPHLDALFETEGFNAPYEWEFEGETETEESPFHFTYRVEGDELKIYDEHEEFSIDYGEEFGYKARDKKLDKIEQALKEDGFDDEVLEWENNVIMSIHIPESKIKKLNLDENLGEDFFGTKEGSEEADDLLFGLQVEFGHPEYGYDDFRKVEIREKDLELARKHAKELDKFHYFEEKLEESSSKEYFKKYEKELRELFNIYINEGRRVVPSKVFRDSLNNSLNDLSSFELVNIINGSDLPLKATNLKNDEFKVKTSIPDYVKICIDQNRYKLGVGNYDEGIQYADSLEDTLKEFKNLSLQIKKDKNYDNRTSISLVICPTNVDSKYWNDENIVLARTWTNGRFWCDCPESDIVFGKLPYFVFWDLPEEWKEKIRETVEEINSTNESLKESTSYPEFLGFINGTLEELNPEEFVEKVKKRQSSLHTNRIALASEDEYIVYTIVCGIHGFGTLEDVGVYVDIIKEDWTRKHGVDMDDPESYKFEESQERVLMEDCGEAEDKWERAIEVIEKFKDEHIDLSKKESYNTTGGGTAMDEKKLNEEKSPVIIDGLNITKIVDDEFENHSWLMKKLGE